jgi:hypothetical protein
MRAVELALAQRTAGMIADAGDYAELSVDLRDCELPAIDHDFGDGGAQKICYRAQVAPIVGVHRRAIMTELEEGWRC